MSDYPRQRLDPVANLFTKGKDCPICRARMSPTRLVCWRCAAPGASPVTGLRQIWEAELAEAQEKKAGAKP